MGVGMDLGCVRGAWVLLLISVGLCERGSVCVRARVCVCVCARARACMRAYVCVGGWVGGWVVGWVGGWVGVRVR